MLQESQADLFAMLAAALKTKRPALGVLLKSVFSVVAWPLRIRWRATKTFAVLATQAKSFDSILKDLIWKKDVSSSSQFVSKYLQVGNMP